MGKVILSTFLTILILLIGTVLFFQFYLDYLVGVLIATLLMTGVWCLRHKQKAIAWGIFLGLGMAVFLLAIAISGMNYAR